MWISCHFRTSWSVFIWTFPNHLKMPCTLPALIIVRYTVSSLTHVPALYSQPFLVLSTLPHLRNAPGKWCFWTVVLEKTLESPLDCKEIQPVHSKGDQSWVFFGRNDAEAETPVLWPPHVKSWLTGKDCDAARDWGQEEKGTKDNEMAGWHHRIDLCESAWTPGVGDGTGKPGVLWFMGSQRVGHDWATELN